MTNEQSQSNPSAGDDVMETVGNLDASTANLNAQTSKGCAEEGEAVSVLTVIGRVLLNLFGK